ncbi:hypothetical protein halTADL_0658 [Halohasta litchfieldiae]|jgi:hypothetical protein|uniref:Ribbon-helix-helix protein, copG family n=1 Tax=Halohasta litchfieldiae TaxID=1073996 RepID=A0A1H6XNH6_9EURY|nr:hypothetical protein [Halohasta litchfieldiae]ATW87460.1 hypothetical protein halTADL_0658 [Halohasta litchfieldiae]SEJ26452.1 hypothetical protein SAMN05444271_13718 [Halohasta litchfieldiae]
MVAEDKTRVDFNAPSSLVEQADTIADLRGVSRTQLLTEALQSEIEEVASDRTFRGRLADAYYAEEVAFDVVESVLGTEAAMRMKLLRESLDREPPEPQLAGSLPTDKEFYEGDVPEWTPEESTDAETHG